MNLKDQTASVAELQLLLSGHNRYYRSKYISNRDH